VIEGRAPVILKTNIANGASTVDGKDLNGSAPRPRRRDAGSSPARIYSRTPAPPAAARSSGCAHLDHQRSVVAAVRDRRRHHLERHGPGGHQRDLRARGRASRRPRNSANRIADLNPNDIENIEVLKGASAAALYGSKAATASS